MNELTDKELNEIVEVASKVRENNENDMIKLKDSVEINESAELESEVKIESMDYDPSDLVTKYVDPVPSADVSLFDLDGDKIKKSIDLEKSLNETLNIPSTVDLYSEHTSDNDGEITISKDTEEFIKDSYDLSDDDIMSLLKVISELKNDDNYPIYKNLPEKFKTVIRDISAKNGIQPKDFNSVARIVISEFLNDSEVESAFIDLEKALNEALNIPSIVDLYSEHTRSVMEENIPEMIEEIKDIDPDKAELLANVKRSFENSYNFSMAKDEYCKNSILRKAVRKNNKNFKRSLDEFNFKNEKSNFKMNDVRELPKVLKYVLIDEANNIYENHKKDGIDIPDHTQKSIDLKITEVDIEKFCILISKSCENMDPRNLIDASYMYYLMKNIIVLKLTKEAKTDFAAELINNICDTITFIRNKEAEHNAANLDKSKS